jgi:hypothetical protein
MKNAIFWDVTLCGSCKNHILEEPITTIIKVRVGELGRTVLPRVKWRYLPGDVFFMAVTFWTSVTMKT